MRVGIVNTKSANFNSVLQALKRLEIEPLVSSDQNELKTADKYILPGVGTAQAVMAGIENGGLSDFIRSLSKPLLGICLGMQVLTKYSAEVPLNGGLTRIDTLGIIDSQVEKIQAPGLRLPHMGWNTVRHSDHPLFKGLAQDTYFYFVHSYCVPVCADTSAVCSYGQDFSAAVCKNNFMGVQFHPEKSGAAGAQLLQNFIAL